MATLQDRLVAEIEERHVDTLQDALLSVLTEGARADEVRDLLISRDFKPYLKKIFFKIPKSKPTRKKYERATVEETDKVRNIIHEAIAKKAGIQTPEIKKVVASKTSVSESTVTHILRKMIKEKIVKQEGELKQGSPASYFLTNKAFKKL